MKYIDEIRQATVKVMKTTCAPTKFALFSILIFLLLVFVPVWTTPGNDFFFQLSLLSWDLWMILISLSVSNGLLLFMQLYIRKTVKENGLAHTGKQVMTLGATIISAITSTLACVACYSYILAMLGVGVSTFIATYRTWIAFGAFLITIYAIYAASKRINNHCETCSITKPSK